MFMFFVKWTLWHRKKSTNIPHIRACLHFDVNKLGSHFMGEPFPIIYIISTSNSEMICWKSVANSPNCMVQPIPLFIITNNYSMTDIRTTSLIPRIMMQLQHNVPQKIWVLLVILLAGTLRQGQICTKPCVRYCQYNKNNILVSWYC